MVPLKSFVYVIKYELDIKVFNFENWLFSIVIPLLKSDLRISTAEKEIGMIRIKHFVTR